MNSLGMAAVAAMLLLCPATAIAQDAAILVDKPGNYGAAAEGSISIVLFSELLYATSGTQQRTFGAGDDEDLAMLRLEVSKNPAAQSALAAAGLTTKDVIAIGAAQSGGLVLYVDDL